MHSNVEFSAGFSNVGFAFIVIIASVGAMQIYTYTAMQSIPEEVSKLMTCTLLIYFQLVHLCTTAKFLAA